MIEFVLGVAPSRMGELVDAFSQRLLLWLAILTILVTAGAYLLGKIRAKPAQKEPLSAELLTKFRELHSQGVLEDSEFRTIKTNLSAQLREELKDTDETV